MNNKLLAVVVVVILIAGGFILFKSKTIAPTDGEVNNYMPVPGSNVDEMIVTEEIREIAPVTVKEFSVSAAPYSFSTKSISVNKGDTVKITLKNTKGTHDLKIDEYGVATRVLNAGEEQTLTFLADKVGSFEYYCSVGNHRAMGMVGTLSVK